MHHYLVEIDEKKDRMSVGIPNRGVNGVRFGVASVHNVDVLNV